jgi:tRNA dimethylallyltransferase
MQNSAPPRVDKVGMVPFSAILIAGPTASGKSALAVALARRHHGIVINADSMQVYCDLRVLTARPDETALAAVPHELYGHVDGAEHYSVGRWLADAARVLERCRTEGRVPVFVGGTGLYFKALLEGLSPIPEIPAPIRAHWRDEAQKTAASRLHALLSERDPITAAGLKATDTQRLTRALEVFDATGRGLADWQREPGNPVISDDDQLLKLTIAIGREALHARADMRFDQMMKAGAIEEVERLAARSLSRELPIMRALGVAPLMDALHGKLTVAEAVDRAKLETRQYIKRQETWLRRHMMSWKSLLAQDLERISDQNFPFE